MEPTDEKQLVDCLAWASANQQPVELCGTGSKRAYGRPVQAAAVLNLACLTGIVTYEPAELVLTARAGTRLAEIEATLDAAGQQLAFEPADLGPLLGQPAGAGSIGGTFATNLAGPRRLKAGAARDHVLGVRCVSGRGEAFKAGGAVVKNVTGFDLPKLLTGSFGTLAAISEITLKALPRPEQTRTVLLPGLSAEQAQRAMLRALQSSHEVSAAAFLPQGLAERSRDASLTAIRVEGPGPSVDWRCASLRNELADLGPTGEMGSDDSRVFWREAREVAFLVGGDEAVWRLAVPPASGATVLADLGRHAPGRGWLDRGGGQVWWATAAGPDAGAQAVRAAAGRVGGVATLVRAPAETRAAVSVFHPQPAAIEALSSRIKEAFDPRRILNPGRMWPGL